MSQDLGTNASPTTANETNSAANAGVSATDAARSYYTLSATSFSNYVWIRNQYFFKNPTSLSLELVGPAPSSFDIEAVHSLSGGPAGPFFTYVFKARNVDGGWHSFEFKHLDPLFPDGNFKFRLVNRSTGTVRIHTGALEFG